VLVAGDSSSPDWSPDGTQIAYTFNLHLHIHSLATGESTRVPVAGMNLETGPSWSPDGTSIAFAGGPDALQSDIYVVGRDGDGLRNLTNTPGEDEFAPSWAPDGSRIAFTRGDFFGTKSLFVMPAGGGGATQLTFPVDPYRTDDESADWSPDSARLVFSRTRYEGGIGASAAVEEAIYTVSAAGGAPTALTPVSGNEMVAHSPTWSPSGSRIAFAGSAGEVAGIWVMGHDGRGLRHLHDPRVAGPAPDWGSAGSYHGGACGRPADEFPGDGGGPRAPKAFGRVRAMRNGVAWKLGCPARSGRCRASVKLTGRGRSGRRAPVLGRRSARVASRGTAMVTCLLNRAGRRALARDVRLTVKAKATVRYTAAGGARKRLTRTRTVELGRQR
jgi:dipeptidyl aminopeptidase/acylaminoacyl peptidase